ncbi:MAG: hypothetical protein EOO77_09850 [Oxalobacteraceae bacterium]|nr:MAG: hypothetical protein EOO77_09850 [Oxalobacteraceae bacterium]
MDVWHYQNRDRLYALTANKDGSNLADELRPWVLRGSVTLLGQADDEREAISLITEHGYCYFK